MDGTKKSAVPTYLLGSPWTEGADVPTTVSMLVSVLGKPGPRPPAPGLPPAREGRQGCLRVSFQGDAFECWLKGNSYSKTYPDLLGECDVWINQGALPLDCHFPRGARLLFYLGARWIDLGCLAQWTKCLCCLKSIARGREPEDTVRAT